MEVSQAIWLMVFLFDALLISPKRFDEIILDFYQDAGIWIVIASCVAEYLLLLTYIGVAAYDFFKNRKMMKKMNVQRRTYEFLKFDESHRDVGNRLHKTKIQSENLVPSFKKGRDASPAYAAPEQVSSNLEVIDPEEGGAKLFVQHPSNPQLLKFDGDSNLLASKKKKRRLPRYQKGKGE